MKILLINPPFNRLKGIRTIYFPMGLGYIAATLNKAGHEVKLWNAEIPKEPLPEYSVFQYERTFQQHEHYLKALERDDIPVWQEAASLMDEFEPDLVGIGAMSSKYPSAMKIAAIAKRRRPECRVVMGGPHPTIQPDEVLKDPNVDFVVSGEGERTTEELCRALQGHPGELANIAGLSFKRDGKTIHNKPRDLIRNLDEIPVSGRDLAMDSALYPAEIMGCIVASRGCPFRCGFCGAHCIWTRKMRFRSPASVVDEIQAVMEKYGTRYFDFWDDSFTVNKKHAAALCNEIIRRKLNIAWYCSTRVDLLDNELLALMKKAGCDTIALGIESGSDRILEMIHKDITVEQCRDAVRMIRGHGIHITVFLMIGYPEETEEDMKKTIRLARSFRGVRAVRTTVFTPYPGSELYDVALKLDLIPSHIEWQHFDHQSPENHFVKNVGRERFRELVSELACEADHNNRSRIRRIQNICFHMPYLLGHPSELMSKIGRRLGR